MKILFKLLLPLSLISSFLLLAACMDANAAPTLELQKPGSYEGVLVSDSSVMAGKSGYEEVYVEGKDKADALIEALNGKELVEAEELENQEWMDLFEETGSYLILLYNKPAAASTSEDIYPIYFYKDGTIQVNQDGGTYYIAYPPEGLLEELKKDWSIDF